MHAVSRGDEGALLAFGGGGPACGTWSSRVHSSYARQVRDLPVGGRPVVIRLAVRRFLCQNAACTKVTFAGQADGLTARYQRWSVPLAALLSQVALELAGRAGTRLAAALGIMAHRSTLPRLVLDLPDRQVSAAPEILGVDDFAPQTEVSSAWAWEPALITRAMYLIGSPILRPGAADARLPEEALLVGTGRQFETPRLTVSLGHGTGLARVARLESDRADRQVELLEHLQANAAHYGQAMFRSLDTATIVGLLAPYTWNGKPLVELVEPTPITVAGNFLVLRAPVNADEDSGVARVQHC